jgi:hypothetical protein
MTIQNVVRWEVTELEESIASMAIADGLGSSRQIVRAAYMPQRYTSVQEMMALPLYFAAHRGGGLEYPEESLRSYTQSVYQGYGMLECSIARTSDGVYFGLHDIDMDRTSGGDFPEASEMTWAEVQQEVILPPAGVNTPSEPYMRLEELAEAYSASHNLIVDPKHIDPEHYPELLDLMDSYGGNARWVGKYVGHSPNWWNGLTARGYESFRPFFQGEWPDTPGEGNPPSGVDDVTIVGIDATAAQTYYDDLMDTGKPIWTHGTTSQADADTAISRGADCVQSSVPRQIDPYAQ